MRIRNADVSRLEINEAKHKLYFKAIREWPGKKNAEVEIMNAPLDSYNHQFDGHSCGSLTCLKAEAFLFNNGNTLLNNFDVKVKRTRILRHIRLLLSNDKAVLELRAVSKQQNGVDGLSPCRQSARLQAKTSTTPIIFVEKKKEYKKKDKTFIGAITQRCHLKHPRVGCVTLGAGHSPPYLNSG